MSIERFKHASGSFLDNTDYVEVVDGKDAFCVSHKGERKHMEHMPISLIDDFVNEGAWVKVE